MCVCGVFYQLRDVKCRNAGMSLPQTDGKCDSVFIYCRHFSVSQSQSHCFISHSDASDVSRWRSCGSLSLIRNRISSRLNFKDFLNKTVDYHLANFGCYEKSTHAIQWVFYQFLNFISSSILSSDLHVRFAFEKSCITQGPFFWEPMFPCFMLFCSSMKRQRWASGDWRLLHIQLFAFHAARAV